MIFQSDFVHSFVLELTFIEHLLYVPGPFLGDEATERILGLAPTGLTVYV